MYKRIIALAVTLVLLYTLGGKHEQIYDRGQGTDLRENVEEGNGAIKGTGGTSGTAVGSDGSTLGGDEHHHRGVRETEKRFGRIVPVEVEHVQQGDGEGDTVRTAEGETTGDMGGTFGGVLCNIGVLDSGGDGEAPVADIGEPEGNIEDTETDQADIAEEVVPEPVEEPEPEPEPVSEVAAEPQMEYLGDWTISFYCNCSQCCGQWAGGATASGVMPTPWYTVATGGLDFGTILYIDGLGYFEVQDRGTDYGWADVFVSDHGEALANGLQTRAVYIVR